MFQALFSFLLFLSWFLIITTGKVKSFLAYCGLENIYNLFVFCQEISQRRTCELLHYKYNQL